MPKQTKPTTNRRKTDTTAPPPVSEVVREVNLPKRYSHNTYNEDYFEAICQWLEEGEGIRGACEKSGTGVSPSTFHTWMKQEGSRYERYARAQDIGWRIMAERLWEIVNDGEKDYYFDVVGEGENQRTVKVLDKAKLQRDRLRADKLQWLLAKKLPKEYGDKLELNGDLNHTHQVVEFVPQIKDK